MYINQKWDYPTMAVCATKLDELRDASNANKVAMDKAFETLDGSKFLGHNRRLAEPRVQWLGRQKV